jgi:hypothetical protein
MTALIADVDGNGRSSILVGGRSSPASDECSLPDGNGSRWA